MRKYENNHGKYLTTPNILISLFIVIALISISVIFVLNFRPFYYMEINRLNVAESSGLSVEEIKSNYDALIEYNSVFYRGDLEFPTLAMSESGRIHFEEVKVIFVALQLMGIILGLISVIWAVIKIRNGDYKFLRLSAILSLLLPITVAVFIATNWNRTFVLFHELFFNNNYWIFDAATDPVITKLPDRFFMDSAIIIVLLIIL